MSSFLAEASVLIKPNTAAFRAELEAQLAAATKGIVVPVSVAATSAGSASTAAVTQKLASAQVAQAEAAQVAGAAAQSAAVQTTRLSTAQTAAATAATKLALAESEVVGAASAAGAASTTLTRATAAVAAAQRAVDLAVRTTNAELIAATTNTLALAEAQKLESVSALGAARSQAAHASTLAAVGKAGGASGAALLGLRGAALTAGAAFLGVTVGIQAFIKSVQSAAALETQLNVFRVTAGATADEMKRVSQTAQALGRDLTLPGVTASTAAEAMTALAKAGLSVQDSIDATRGTLQLATAAEISAADAAQLVASSLNSFRLAGTDAVKVADLLAGAAKESQGSITEMGFAFRFVAAQAEFLGVPIEDVVTQLTQLSRAGIDGTLAGTSLRESFRRLASPTAAAAALIERLKIQVRDVQGNIRPEVFRELQQALLKLSVAQRQQALDTLFGARASAAASILGRDSVQSYQQLRDAVTEAGLAQEQAAARTQGFQGDIENLSNQASSLGLTIGALAKGPLGLFARTLADQLSSLNDVVVGFGNLGAATKRLGDSFNEAVPGAEKTKDVLKNILLFSNPVTRQLKLMSFAFDKLGLSADNSAAKLNVFDAISKNVKATMDDLVQTLAAAGAQLATQLPKDTGLGAKQIQNIVVGFDAKEVRAKISGSNADLLTALREEQAFLETQLKRQYVKNRPALKRDLEKQLLGVVSDITSVQDQASAAAEKAANERKQKAQAAQAAANAADQALLSQLGVSRTRQENKIAAAEQTTSLKDDVARQNEYVVLLKAQIVKIREQVTDTKAQQAAIAALQSVIIQVRGALKNLKAQQEQLAQDRRDALTNVLGQKLQLAELRGNKDEILAAINSSIADAKKRVRAAKTLADRLDEQIALQELVNQKNELLKNKQESGKDAGKVAAKFLFDQLQAQQGFASNLLGNLIPSSATGGLVGGSQVGAGLAPTAAVQDAKSQNGVTSGQGQTTNHILAQILAQLKTLNGDAQAPEATRQRMSGHHIMDGGGGSG